MTDESGIDVSFPGKGVAVVTINRPDKANALTGPMHYRLTHVWPELENNDEVGAIVLTAAGDAFCGGGDREKWDALANDRRYRRRRMIEARQLILNMLRCELPIIAAVNGAAVGVGCSIVMACDVVLMAPDAYLSDPHVMAGIVAGDGGAALMPELLPLPLARKMLFTGARLDAQTALEVHFATEIVAREHITDHAIALATRVATLPWEAVRDTKRTVNMGLLGKVSAAFEFGAAAESSSFDTDQFRDGGKA
jgi:enoyl-CoA hydratase